MIILETERTYLRPLALQDAADFYALNLDPEVLQFTGDQAFESIAAAEFFLANYDQYQKYGAGRFAVLEKQSQRFIGWCGLKYSPDVDEYDIGFRFYKAYWSKGFATETAKKCLEFGFNNLGLEKIVGRVMEENKASIKVLEKIGMIFDQHFDFEGQAGLIYHITKMTHELL